jgi:hypothetical protein
MTTLDDITRLAALVTGLRPTWDKIAIQNQLLAYKHLPYEQLAYAAIRCAQDPNNRTPASLKWADLAPPGSAERNDLEEKQPTCHICGKYRNQCQQRRDFEIRRGLPDPHEFETLEDADQNTAHSSVA